MAAFFHFAARGLPPFLVVIRLHHIGHEHVFHLVRGCEVAVAVHDHFNHFIVMQGRHLFQAIHVRGLARFDMVLGDGGEDFRREGEVNSVTGAAGEIHGHFAEHHVHGFDLTEAPAFVHTKTLGGQLNEGIHIGGAYLSAGRQFLKFFFHTCDNAPPRERARVELRVD